MISRLIFICVTPKEVLSQPFFQPSGSTSRFPFLKEKEKERTKETEREKEREKSRSVPFLRAKAKERAKKDSGRVEDFQGRNAHITPYVTP